MSETEEVAKAAAEAAKFGTKALDTTEKLASFASRVFKEPIEEAVGIVGDRLKFMRWQRLVRLADKVSQILKDRGINDTRAVLPKLALPIFENASLEENDELHDLWAKLLANSMDPNFDKEIRYAYLEIIKSLSPLDVKNLSIFYNTLNKENIDWNKITESWIPKEEICKTLKISQEQYAISMYNLFRVQCLAPAILKHKGALLGDEPLTIYKGIDGVVMTPLGRNFIEACIK